MSWDQAFQIIITIMIGLIGFFLKTEKGRTNNEIQENKNDISKLDERIDELERSLPFTYVTRDDYIRQMATFEHKLDKIYSALERGHRE